MNRICFSMDKLFFFGFLGTLGTFAVATPCTFVRDVDVIIELPQDGTPQTMEEAGKFVKSLAGEPREGRCWRARITVADKAVIPINTFGCHSAACMGSLSTKVFTAESTGTSPRENVNKVLGKIDEKARASDAFLDAGRKLVVLVLADTPQHTKNLTQETINSLQESSYDFVAIGVGIDWKGNDLVDVALSPSRVFKLAQMGQLNAGIEFNEHEKILKLLNDPAITFPDSAANSAFPDGYDVGGEESSCKIDLGFILDSSSSLKYNYHKEKNFIKKMAQTFDLREGGTHAGVVTFSSQAKLSIKLNQFRDIKSFEDAVDAIEHMDRRTRIDKALLIARDQLFTQENGGRRKKEKVLVILTDGNQDPGAPSPAPLAEAIRKKGIHTLVIGFGAVSDRTLKSISGTGDDWRRAADFDVLESNVFVHKMTRKACDLVTIVDVCKTVVDICFLLDSSGSIQRPHWEQIKEFVTRIADRFGIAEGGPHASAVVFSDVVNLSKSWRFTKVTIRLGDHNTNTGFRHAVDASPYYGYRTRIDLGFQYAEHDVFTQRSGARPNTKRVIILLTDGYQNPKIFDPVAASKKVYDDGAKIYAVGIGKRVDLKQLESITRHKDRVFKADTFKHLESTDFVNEVSRKTCTYKLV